MNVVKKTAGPLMPWQELGAFQNRLRRVLGDAFDNGFMPETVGWMPAMDITENADSLTITAELPGMTQADVQVEIEDNVLTLRGEKKAEHEKEDAKGDVHVWERTYGGFQRSFLLPRTVDVEKVDAGMKNGVLTLTLPKTPQARGRKIEVKDV